VEEKKKNFECRKENLVVSQRECACPDQPLILNQQGCSMGPLSQGVNDAQGTPASRIHRHRRHRHHRSDPFATTTATLIVTADAPVVTLALKLEVTVVLGLRMDVSMIRTVSEKGVVLLR